ncbi:HEAT repeat domain-containing protein [Dyadobacter sp. CY326]|uniref:HEAT repeat domain-containing protein n=1 Tax=Dyadobacter sp. CY326 TaxID=2907300 RepID=UPI001F21BBC2|nr:HEAT repeat domain-containing protein [Dyadobacter sp. CY326]MCE7065938.1 HEAT repeat domain-containing protein [Dyadobacter sp. CY326]
MSQDIEILLEKYYDGETSVEEERELKNFFQNAHVPEHLKSHAAQFNYFTETRNEHPSLLFSSQLAAQLDPPQQTPVRKITSWIVRIAAGLALLIVGFTGGWLMQRKFVGNPNVASSGAEASANEMKKVLAFEQMNVTSASERILAVNQSYDMAQVDTDITQLLINTLNFDPNVNVRLAACQALLHFQSEPGISEALIQSLAIQSDPNVQISLIESLVSIKEKRAEAQFMQIANNRDVLDVVRLKAEEGITRLRADA